MSNSYLFSFSLCIALFFYSFNLNKPSFDTAGGIVTNMKGISLFNGMRIKIGDKIKNIQEVKMFPEAVLELQDSRQGLHYYEADKTCTGSPCQPALVVSVDKRGMLKFGTQPALEELRLRFKSDSLAK
jgi:hypothetical protein